MYGCPHRCSTYSKGKYNRTILQRFYKLPYELGGTPFGQWARSAPGPTINQGTPRAPSNNLRNKTTCNFTRGYATFKKHLGSGNAPPVHRSRATSSPWAGKGAPSFYQTISTRYYASGSIHLRKLRYKILQTSSTKIVFMNKNFPEAN